MEVIYTNNKKKKLDRIKCIRCQINNFKIANVLIKFYNKH